MLLKTSCIYYYVHLIILCNHQQALEAIDCRSISIIYSPYHARPSKQSKPTNLPDHMYFISDFESLKFKWTLYH